jgi:hypothetical protein
VEGLKRAKVKPLNYSQVTVVQQVPDENPLTFLKHLKDAIQKHSTVVPESLAEQILLKDKFLTQPQISVENSKSLWLKGKKIIGPTNATSHVCIL